MRSPVVALVSFTLALLAAADSDPEFVRDKAISVFLFAQAAYFSEVAIDVNNDTCFSLDNNLIDGKVQSVLVGGHDIWGVFDRRDEWYCVLYNNYDCGGPEDKMVTVPGGHNNLRTEGWGDKVHSVRCVNET